MSLLLEPTSKHGKQCARQGSHSLQSGSMRQRRPTTATLAGAELLLLPPQPLFRPWAQLLAFALLAPLSTHPMPVANVGQPLGRSCVSTGPWVLMPCMATSTRVSCGWPTGLGRMESAYSSCLTMAVAGLWSAFPNHLTLWLLRSWAGGCWLVSLSSSVVEGHVGPRRRPTIERRQAAWKISIWDFHLGHGR